MFGATNALSEGFQSPPKSKKLGATAKFLVEGSQVSEELFGAKSKLFGSAPSSVFSVAPESEGSSLLASKSKPSIKSRLGTADVTDTNPLEDEKSVFSKPKLVRTAMVNKSGNLADVETKKHDERELSETECEDSDGGTRRPRMKRTGSKEELSMLTSSRCEVVMKTSEFPKMSKNLNFEVKTKSDILSRI
jgi:hypothetical protein